VTQGSDLAERIALLGGAWLFSACSADELERIAALASSRDATAGDELTRQGDDGDEFFLVVAGDAIATVDGDAIGELGPGSFFGEMALIDGGERTATVTATTDMQLLVLDRHEFNEMLEVAMPSVAPKLLAVVGARMRLLEQHAGVAAALGL
jgi:CRP/FNR family cyclic AMP-dependent transcriptional regulator